MGPFAALAASLDRDDQAAALALVQRASATPPLAAALFRLVLESDFREVAAAVRVPTTVFHRVENRFVPARLGRDLAARIPGATFVELPGPGGLFDGPDQMQVIARLGQLVTGRPVDTGDQRRLAAVVFTDIVASTEHVSAIGDQRWRAALDMHDSIAPESCRLTEGGW